MVSLPKYKERLHLLFKTDLFIRLKISVMMPGVRSFFLPYEILLVMVVDFFGGY